MSETSDYITEVTLYVATPEGFDTQIKVIGLQTKGLTGSLKGLSRLLLDAGFVTSSVAQRNQVAVKAIEDNPDYPKCPDCGGPTERKEGKAKNGKPWAGYFCLRTAGLPKGQGHTPTWIDQL